MLPTFKAYFALLDVLKCLNEAAFYHSDVRLG